MSFVRMLIMLILPYDVALIYAAYAKCRKIQMASSVACMLFARQAFILSLIYKYK